MKKSILFLSILSLVVTFASCNKEDMSQREAYINGKIIGKWKLVKQNGVETATNDRTVWTYFANGKGKNSGASYIKEIDSLIWLNRQNFDYEITDKQLLEKVGDGTTKLFNDLTYLDDNKMCMTLFKVNKDEIKPNVSYDYRKITADFSQSILGVWEGVEITGEETYGGAEARIEYKADGTYIYYVKDDSKKGDIWVVSDNVDNEYFVDGDWLAHHWRPTAGAELNYELWDIKSISKGQMKWSALREKEDGTRYTTTFTWKKVND